MTHVAVKVRTSTFFTRSKISKLPEPTTDPAEVARAALSVLDRFELFRPVRLLGVRVELEQPANDREPGRAAMSDALAEVLAPRTRDRRANVTGGAWCQLARRNTPVRGGCDEQ